MKKHGSLALFLLLAISQAAFGNYYNSSTGVLTIEGKQGWNLLPANMESSLLYVSPEFSTDCAIDTAKMFIFLPESQTYWPTGGQPPDGYMEKNGEYLPWAINGYMTAWAYLPSDCTVAKMNVSALKSHVPPKGTHKLAKGWNFVPLGYAFFNRDLSEAFSDCDILATYRWDAEKQDWASASEFLEREYTLGSNQEYYNMVLAIKLGSECRISTFGQEISGPPGFPE
jgi:hypothetical protein